MRPSAASGCKRLAAPWYDIARVKRRAYTAELAHVAASPENLKAIPTGGHQKRNWCQLAGEAGRGNHWNIILSTYWNPAQQTTAANKAYRMVLRRRVKRATRSTRRAHSPRMKSARNLAVPPSSSER